MLTKKYLPILLVFRVMIMHYIVNCYMFVISFIIKYIIYWFMYVLKSNLSSLWKNNYWSQRFWKFILDKEKENLISMMNILIKKNSKIKTQIFMVSYYWFKSLRNGFTVDYIKDSEHSKKTSKFKKKYSLLLY